MAQKRQSNEPNGYLKYSQLGLQLFLTIGLCGWLGYKMDQWWNGGNSLFVILMVLIGAGGGIYQLYRSLPKD
ncbi:MAG: AtpZ/AtpI family protein [Cytophagia bacterium]|nr:AtpZ/AtpI family protein [Cytophagia bacterium]